MLPKLGRFIPALPSAKTCRNGSAPLRKALDGGGQAEIMLADIGRIRRPFDKSTLHLDVSLGGDRDVGISIFRARGAARRATFAHSQIRRRDAAPRARAMDIAAEPVRDGIGFRRVYNYSYMQDNRL